MRFGLFCSAQANSNTLGPETGQGFRDYLDYNVEAEALGFHSTFSVEHHFTGWNQVSATLMLLMALAIEAGFPAPTQSGGCGVCAGGGSTTMSSKFQY